MSDLAPRNSVARFGVSFVGPTFVWAYAAPGDDGDLVMCERTFRAHPGLSFAEQLEYQRSLTMLQATALLEQKKMTAVLEKIGELPDDADTTEELNKLADDVTAGEAQRWAMVIDQTVMLVTPADREEFRELISAGNAADVRVLKEWLVETVITRTKKEVEAVAGVDPTSQPSSSG